MRKKIMYFCIKQLGNEIKSANTAIGELKSATQQSKDSRTSKVIFYREFTSNKSPFKNNYDYPDNFLFISKLKLI